MNAGISIVEREAVRIYSPGVARAMLRTESQYRSVGDRLRALRRESEFEKRRAASLQIGISVNLHSQCASAPTSLNMAALFPSAYQVLQTDRGLTYGGTMRASAANTSTTVVSLTGLLPTSPVPIWVKATNTLAVGSGAQFGVYFDGLGVTPATTVTPTAGSPIALGGAGAGLSLTWSAGNSVSNDSWKATCAALADQTVNAKHVTQATAAAQPIVTSGLNGKVGLLFDGVDDYLSGTVGTLLAGVYIVLVVGRITASFPGNNSLVGGGGFFGTIYEPAVNLFSQYNNNGANVVGFSALTNQRWAAVFHNGTADSLRIGSIATVTGQSAGIGNTTNYYMGATGTVPGQFGKVELFAVLYLPAATDYSAFDAAINSSPGYGSGSIGV